MSTIKEVSRQARVSMATVSRVINGTVPVSEEIRQRVLKAISDLNYRPNAFAKGLVTNRSGGIGVVVNDLSSPFFGPMLRGIEEVIEQFGMHLMVSSGHAQAASERRAVDFLYQRRSDALILHVEELGDAELMTLTEESTPVILVGRHVPELAGACVYLDNEEGGSLATRHLLEGGHRRIAHISGPLSIHDSRSRLAGYRRALEEAGVAYRADLVLEADFQEEGGRLATKRLLARDLGFTALFVGNDQMAAGALSALREAGLSVPHDVSLIGYDDVLLARYLYPALTTVSQPMGVMGRAAAQLALNHLKGEKTEVENRFQPNLMLRHSTRSLNSSNPNPAPAEILQL